MNDLPLADRIKALTEKFNQQLPPVELRVDQYDLIAKLRDYLKKSNDKLTNSELMGLCHGLVVYYFYLNSQNKKADFFNRLKIITAADLSKEIDHGTDIEFQKLLNHVRWLHAPRELINTLHQKNIHESVQFVIDKNEKPIVQEHSIASIFTESEFINTLQSCVNTERMISLGTGSHAMGLRIVNNKYYFYDPDFKGGNKELEFDSLEDIYAWLVYQNCGYDLSKVQNNAPQYIPIEIEICKNPEQHEISYPNAVTVIEQFMAADTNYLERQAKRNLLFLNCVAYQPEIVERLLKEEVIRKKIDEPEEWMGFTPLLYCCQEGYPKLIKLLLEAGADPNANPKAINSTPLLAAIRSGNAESVQLLIGSGADIYKEPYVGSFTMPLFIAAEQDLEVFKIIFNKHLDKHGDVNITNMENETLLHTAVKLGNYKMVEFLLEQPSININAVHRSSAYTPLNVAANNGDIKMMELLLKHGATFDSCKIHPLVSGIGHGRHDIVNYLLEHSKIDQTTLDAAFTEAIVSNKLPLAFLIHSRCAPSCKGDIIIRQINNMKLNDNIPFLKMVNSLLDQNKLNILPYDMFARQSLASWALNNKNLKEPVEAKNCIDKILHLIDNDKKVSFVTETTVKLISHIKELKEKMIILRKEEAKSGSFHKSSKDILQDKIIGLDQLLYIFTSTPEKPILDIIKENEWQCPTFLKDKPDSVHALVDWLTAEQKKQFPSLSFQIH